MMENLRPIISLIVLAGFGFLLTGCGGGEHDGPGNHHSILEEINEHTGPNANGGISSEPWLEGVSWSRVRGIDLKGTDTFFVADRTTEITRYPCSECHNQPVASFTSSDTSKVRAHWEVEIKHASAEVMSCATCHGDDDMEELHTLHGEKVSLDESYQVCAQCHSTQANEWVVGAHGKRVGGWAPPRVVSNCTSCHNPHDPGFPSRFPARAARVVGDGGLPSHLSGE